MGYRSCFSAGKKQIVGDGMGVRWCTGQVIIDFIKNMTYSLRLPICISLFGYKLLKKKKKNKKKTLLKLAKGKRMYGLK